MSTSSDHNFLKDTVAPARRAVMSVGLISLFINLLMLTVPLYMLQLYDRVLASRSQDTLIYLTIAAVGALAVLGGLDMLRLRVLARVSTWIENRVGPEALGRAVASKVQAQGYGAQSLRDLTQVRQFIASPGLLNLFDAPWVPIYLCVILLLHPVLGFVGIIGALMLFAIAIANEVATRKPLAEANNHWVRAMGKTEAAVRNAEVIEAMGILPGVVRRWFADNQEALTLQEKAHDRASVLLASSKFLRLSVQIAMLGTGAYLVVQQAITGGVMIAGSIILSRALQPVEQALGTWKTLISARAAYDRLKAYIASAPVRETDMALPAPAGYLSVEQLIFVPPGGNKPTLKGISFSLSPGQILSVVGPSAAGKSTLARLLVGAWRPYAGVVRLDGANVYAWDRVEFGRHVGYLPQDVELFEGTIAENIARLGHTDPKAVVTAARQAGVHELILRLANGYHTVIGPGGATLSGGQRQRIALARALFGAPRLIVLDEPNANLDSAGERALLKAMFRAKEGGAAVVFISHRPKLVSCADKMLFLRDGLVQMFGPRDQVLRRLIRPASTRTNQHVPARGGNVTSIRRRG